MGSIKIEQPKGAEKMAREQRLLYENARLRKDLAEALTLSEKNSTLGGLYNGLLTAEVPDAPVWVRKVKGGAKQATPTAFLSDTHFGERVFADQVEYLNAYDRKIAEKRLKNFFHNATSLAKDYLKGLDYNGIVCPLGGDIFSGDIHEELARTNEGTIQEEILYWLGPMISGLKLLADEFGRVYVPCVVGNHPRGTKKPSHKMRVPNNFDWLFAVLLERFLADDKRITFNVSRSADLDYPVYSTRYRLSHGDQFRGGSGIAGLLSPLMIGDARKRKRAQATGTEYDWLLLGHWHQLATFKNIIVNGSVKGYDEYAYHSNFEFEPPRQAFWLTDPVHGVTIQAPIHVIDKSEKWSKKNV
jgi:hypothetical protein